MRKKRADVRRPIMGARLKLEVRNKDPNYEYRWFNDDGNRIQEAIESGREYVLKDDVVLDTSMEPPPPGSYVTKAVGRHPDGSPKMAYLLRIHKSWYDEDQLEKQKANDLIDQAVRSGSISTVPNAYTPGHDRIAGDVVKITR